MTDETKLYGVSTGNGNDGISHMFPDYYVRTNDPWKLCKLATVSTFKEGAGQAWARKHMDVDGDEEFQIQASFYAPPCETTADGEYPEIWKCNADGCGHTQATEFSTCPECGAMDAGEDNCENAEDGRHWGEHNGAWMLLDVFPVAESDVREGRPMFDSLEEAFGKYENLLPTEETES